MNLFNTKKINDNWTFISNKNLNKNINNSKNNNNFKNMSFDSFWTSDTNNLSILLNAINDKIFTEETNKINNNRKFKKKKDISYRNINHKFIKNKNQKRKEIKSSNKNIFKKENYKKIDNKKLLSENSRNNNFLKAKTKQAFYNNLNTAKPLSTSLSNYTHYNKCNNKPNNIFKHLLTEKNLDNNEINKNVYQYYSIQRLSSNKNCINNLKKNIPSIEMKIKYLIKDIKKNKSLSIKKKSENMLKNIKNKSENNKNKNKKVKKKSEPKEYLKIFPDNENKNKLKDKSIKEENSKDISFNSKTLYNTNNNFNILRNKKYFIKKYFTNNNFNKKNTNANRRYTTNLTESNSQTLLISKKEKEKEREFSSSGNNYFKSKEINVITLNNCHTTTNYYILKNKKLNTYINEKKFNKTNNNYNNKNKQKKDDGVMAARDRILKGERAKAYIKKNCFSPLSNNYIRRYSLSKSCNMKNKNNKGDKKNLKLIQRQMNSEISNKLSDIQKNIRKQFFQQNEYNNIYEKTYYCNKFNNNISNSNADIFNIKSSQKEFKNINLMKLNDKSKDKFRNNKKIYFRKNFSPTLTYYNLYKSSKINLSQPHKNVSNISGLNDLTKDNLVKNKNKNKNNCRKSYNYSNTQNNTNTSNNQFNLNKLENKENIFNNINCNQKILNKKEKKNCMTKSKTEYKHFKSNYNSTNNINGMNKNEKKNILIKIK